VDRLSKEIGQTNDYSHGLRAPLVEGGVLNPNIVRIVLDSGRNSTVRYSAFCHMLDFDDISSNHYRQLEVVWQSIEDVELKCDINAYVAIYYFRNGWLPPDAFEELGKIPADKCNQKFSEGIQDESA
ncbi:MAG: hypothetical protein QF886_13050, partial [Planctomycetota bacterium]|nr:hypothetical protein [Planctomycetota bacterium]